MEASASLLVSQDRGRGWGGGVLRGGDVFSDAAGWGGGGGGGRHAKKTVPNSLSFFIPGPGDNDGPLRSRRTTTGRRSESTPLFFFPSSLFPIPGISHLLSFSLALSSRLPWPSSQRTRIRASGARLLTTLHSSVVDRVGKIADVVDGGVPGRGSQWVGVLLNGEMDDAVVGKTE